MIVDNSIDTIWYNTANSQKALYLGLVGHFEKRISGKTFTSLDQIIDPDVDIPLLNRDIL